MKKNLILFLLSVVLLVIIVSCGDDVGKMLLSDSQTRIEYSNCTGCYECLEEFHCPEDAIIKDPNTNELTVYIDAEKCVNCLKCINAFSCPDNAITTSPDLIMPGQIENFNALSDSVGVMDIMFTAPGDDDNCGLVYRYELQIFNSEEVQVNFEFQFPLILKEAGETENWQITDLPPGEQLTVSLQAFDEAGLNSAPVSRSVLIADVYVDIFPPSQITDLSSESMEEMVMLTWTASGDDEMEGSSHGYDIRYADSEINDGNWDGAVIVEQDMIPVDPGGTESFSVTEIPWQNDYFFAVKAYDSEGNYSTVSNNTEASIIGDLVAPSMITDLAVSDAAPESILLGWTAVGDNGLVGTASAYVIKVSEDEITAENWDETTEFEQIMEPQPAGTMESINITGLIPLTGYYFAVKAVDEANNVSDISNVVNEMTIDIPDIIPPAAVNDLSAEAEYTQIILSWTATGDDGYEGTAYQYVIKISENTINEDNWDEAELLSDPPTPLLAGTEQNYTITDLQPDTDYYFALKVLDAEENISNLSNVAEATLLDDTTAPSMITDLSVYSGYASNGTIRIEWTASGDNGMTGTASYCEVRTSSDLIDDTNWDSADLTVVITDPEVGGSSETLNVSGLNNGEVIYFAIKVFDAAGNSSEVSNSPWGKIVYTINAGPCNGCGNCVYWCPEDAITDHGSYATIDYQACDGCGTCVNYCPRNAINRYVINSW